MGLTLSRCSGVRQRVGRTGPQAQGTRSALLLFDPDVKQLDVGVLVVLEVVHALACDEHVVVGIDRRDDRLLHDQALRLRVKVGPRRLVGRDKPIVHQLVQVLVVVMRPVSHARTRRMERNGQDQARVRGVVGDQRAVERAARRGNPVHHGAAVHHMDVELDAHLLELGLHNLGGRFGHVAGEGGVVDA